MCLHMKSPTITRSYDMSYDQCSEDMFCDLKTLPTVVCSYDICYDHVIIGQVLRSQGMTYDHKICSAII